MKRELAIEFSRVTEAAALAGYKWLGRGDKNTADGAAVNAMRIMLNLVNIDGTIVIGEGESMKRRCSISAKKSVPATAMR
jgi:fructose-1,6-bisphosphatase II